MILRTAMIHGVVELEIGKEILRALRAGLNEIPARSAVSRIVLAHVIERAMSPVVAIAFIRRTDPEGSFRSIGSRRAVPTRISAHRDVGSGAE